MTELERYDQLGRLKAELKQRIRREQLRREAAKSLESFILYTKPDYIMGWFHRAVCQALDDFINEVVELKNEQLRRAKMSQAELDQLPPLRQGPRLIIQAPPRHGKSEIISRRAPAVAFGRCPDLEMIVASYAQDLANSMSKDLQGVMSSLEYGEVFPDVGLPGGANVASMSAKSPPVQQASKFDVLKYFQTDENGSRKFKKAGSYKAAGIGGGITGLGADMFIIDDPYKDRAEAESAVKRTRVEKWFRSAALTRLSPCGGIIVMCTRWRSDDLIGELIRASENGCGDKYKVISFPAIATEDEPFRKIGEALHPQRFPLQFLEDRRDALGPYDFASLYQQNPIPAEDSVFKQDWIKYYTASSVPPIDAFNKLIISWDMTFKETNTSDFVVGQVWGRKGADFYLLDQVRGRMDFVKTRAAFIKLSAKWPKAHRKLVEDKANGPAIIASLRSEIAGIIPITPKESKQARANAVTTFWESGNVYLPDPEIAPWVTRDFIPELLRFPTDAHDDQVDAMTQALNDLKGTSKVIHPSNLAYMSL